MKFLLLLLLSIVPNNQTTVYIDDFSIYNTNYSITYRINDGERRTHNYKIPMDSPEEMTTIPGTTVRIGWSWEWVFDEWDFILDYEPGTNVIWTY